MLRSTSSWSAKGFTGTFVGPDGVKDDQFIKLAGDASSNAYFTCPCIPGELIPTFETAYKELANAEPGTYSIEGYDAATVLLSRHRPGQARPARTCCPGSSPTTRTA